MDREELIAELRRLEKYGFYVIQEAFELASRMDLTEISAMPLSTAALVISQRAIELKFNQRSHSPSGEAKTKESYPH